MLAVQGPHARAILAARPRHRAAGADAGRDGADRPPPGAGLRHRLHRRGRGRAADRPRGRAGDLGRAARRRRRPLRARRPRHAAARGLLPPARQRPDARAQPDRSRPRLVLRRGDRVHRRRGDRRGPAPRARPRSWRRSRSRAPASRAKATRSWPAGEQVGVVTSGTFSPSLELGIGMAYVRADLAEPGTEVEIDVRGKHRPARIASKPLYQQERSDLVRRALPRRPALPRPARLGAARGR